MLKKFLNSKINCFLSKHYFIQQDYIEDNLLRCESYYARFLRQVGIGLSCDVLILLIYFLIW